MLSSSDNCSPFEEQLLDWFCVLELIAKLLCDLSCKQNGCSFVPQHTEP